MVSRIRANPQKVQRTGKGFGPHEPEVEEKVGQLAFTRDELDHLRRKRDLLRELTEKIPPARSKEILDKVKIHPVKLTLVEALALARREGKILVPHDVIDRIATETQSDREHICSGTLVIFNAPGKPFGESIRKNNILFTVPKKFRDKTNCALVVEDPDFDIVQLGNRKYELRVEDNTRIHLIKDFPGKDGWYRFDERFRIPLGVATASEAAEGRYLNGRMTDDFVSPLARSTDCDDVCQDMDLDNDWFGIRFSVGLY